MKFVVTAAARRALAGLVLCLGFFAIPWTLLARLHDGARPPFGVGPSIRQYLIPPVHPRSQWDIPIAIGFVAACLLAAALIYPASRRRWRLLPDRRDRRVEDDLRVLHR